MAEQIMGRIYSAGNVSGRLSGSPGTSTYTSLSGKPQINGVELNGNKTAAELRLASAEEVEELQKYITSLVDGNEVEY